LEDVFKMLPWENKGVNVDGTYFQHLRFADDIVLISSDIQELKNMLESLNKAANAVGLKMNLSKTKIMSRT